MTLITGQLLAQRYRLERRIAVGGMGEVWQAQDTRLGRQVAVKVLKAEFSDDAEFRDRFHTEARLTASLNNPGIAAVHDYGDLTATPGASGAVASGAFLVMELVDGDSLATILLRDPRLSVDRTLDILGQAGDALQAAHERGLVHRDIKPANILITPAGRVKITDFGIARAVDTAAVTREGMVMGTAHYIAPEQAAGQPAGPASDIYSLGVVGYECLAGQRPFPSDSAIAVALMHIRETPPPLPPDVPPEIRTLIEATLIKDPRLRYGTGGEFAAAVAAVRAGRRPPRPAGMAGTAGPHPPGHYPPGHHPPGHHPPQTALLPAGALSGPPTGPYRGAYPPQRRARRGSAGVALALFAVLALVLAGYLIRDVVQSTGTAPGAGSSAQPASDPDSTSAKPTPTPEPTPPRQAPQQILVFLPDYVLRPADEAAAIAKDKGLQPRVVNDNGDEIDPESQPECRVTHMEPAYGRVAPGSRVTLFCRRGL